MQGSKRVAVVEDDASMGQALERILRLAGYLPAMYATAEAYILNGGAPVADCLVLDVHLPGMSGFELRDHLARAGTTAPVIFITAYDDAETRTLAERANAIYLAKPFTGKTLIDAVARALASALKGNGLQR
jgi:FixJ family two-component response regulator